MSSILGKGRVRSINRVLASLGHELRRRIVAELRRRSGHVDEAVLARRLVAAERGTVTDEAVQTARVALHHNHLPSLAAAGLVEWDEDEGAVTEGSHPILDEPGIDRVLEADEVWDEGLACLADERRRAVVDVLGERDDSMPGRALAREVAAREDDADPTEDAVEAVLGSLHHVHLPALDAAGLVEYDRDAGTVAVADHPVTEVPWFEPWPDEPSTDDSQWLASSPG